MRIGRYGLSVAGALLLIGLWPGDGAPRESVGTRQVLATYRVDLGVFSLGEFKLSAIFNGLSYEMMAKGKFSLMSGMLYRASGSTTSSGRLTKGMPEPSRFALDYKGGDKREKRRMSFSAGTVSDVSIVPRKKQGGNRIPVTAKQLENVLDPLTAAFLSVRSDGRGGDLNVCHQTIPVFDGRHRFDLVLKPKRIETLKEGALAPLSGPMAVCQVRYQPIGGHKPDHPAIKFLTQTDEIEVWLVRLAQTDLYVPYRIVMPTALGQGSVTLVDVSVDTDARRDSIPSPARGN